MKNNPVVFHRFGDVARCVYCLETEDATFPVHLATGSETARRERAAGRLLVLSLHRRENYVFLYYECCGCNLAPDELFPDFAGVFRPMMEVYHSNRPESKSTWQRKKEIRPQGRMIFLRPEMVGSYIFYHYQLQEEQPGADEKHFQISACENLLFLYTEQPEERARPGYAGKLTTHNTPDNWPELMQAHFQPWMDGGENAWRDTETLLSL